MKSLTEYLVENLLLTEGGKAVSGTPMTQPQTKAVYKDVEKNFLPKLGLTADGVDHCVLGSFGKKHDEQTSGDIDIAVSLDVVAAHLGVSLEDVEKAIVEICDKEDIYYKWGKGIHVISMSWPIPGTDDLYGQVDIMPTHSLDFSKWMYYSPDFRIAESKYKGLYRNQLIMAIARMAYKNVLKTTDEGDIVEYDTYVMRLHKGLSKVTKSFQGKRGLKKNETTLKDSENLISNTPEWIVKYLLGEDVSVDQSMTFENVYKIFMSDSFPHKDKRDIIIKKFLDEIVGTFPIPSEVSDDWSQYL